MSEFNTIALIGKYGDPGVLDTLMQLHDYFKSHNRQVVLDLSTAENLRIRDIESLDRDQIGERCDLAIVVGGDGTLLNAARSLADYGVPLLGINLGRLGFLVDISSTHIEETLDEILKGNDLEDERCLITATLEREGEHVYRCDAFNDIAVHKSNTARMIELETYINGKQLYTLRADGVVISTPTGSTAYAMSAGGPILYPGIDAVLIVPICPHTMSSRPIVVPGNCEIEVRIGATNHGEIQVTCDGQLNVAMTNGDRLHVKRKEKKIRLLHPSNYDYFDILREKLHWVGRLS